MTDIARPSASVVIPAHDEGRVIARSLDALRGPMAALGLEIVVAANGCQDDTVAVASTFPGVKVLDLEDPSKVAALNAADEVATAFPRIYLDADVVLDATAVSSLVRTLSTERAIMAVPAVHYERSHSELLVRAFYDALVIVRDASPVLAGRGVYGLSGAARARFSDFPNIQGDDYFVARLFRPSERVITAGTATVQAPRSFADLVRIRTRVAAGNAAVSANHPAVADSLSQSPADFTPTVTGTRATLTTMVLRRPRSLPSAVVFAAVALIARIRARSASSSTWLRDTSTR